MYSSGLRCLSSSTESQCQNFVWMFSMNSSPRLFCHELSKITLGSNASNQVLGIKNTIHRAFSMDFWTRIFCVETCSFQILDLATKTQRSFVNPVCAPFKLSCLNGIELNRRKLRNRGRSSPVQRIFLVVVIKFFKK